MFRAADVVSAYVSSNPVPVGDLPALIGQVYEALGTSGSVSAAEPPLPAKRTRKKVAA
ncbi:MULTISPECIES: MucR family transcriptional regulator [unclassified Mesorhizobium]|uniref:MucR family transcriptional regulator n=1 Tax=unclassified Mesorhizobium TaxID=325217 RepID=UPI003335DF26